MCKERACFCSFAKPGFKKEARNLKAQMRPEVSGSLSPKLGSPLVNAVNPEINPTPPTNSLAVSFSSGFDTGSF